jgi:hypothetical protein
MINLIFDVDPEPIELLSIKAVQAFLNLQVHGGANFRSFEVSAGPFSCMTYSVQECLAALSFLRIEGSLVFIFIREW